MESIVIENVTKRYIDDKGETFEAVCDVSLEWNKGESIGIIGESGSGKSTLAKLLIGLDKPTIGSVLIDKMNTLKWNAKKWKKHRLSLQAAFQDASGTLNPCRTIYNNIEESLCNLTNLTQQERKERIYELMNLMQLDKSLLDTSPQKLSGGEQRRFGLVRSLAVKPEFLVLDEVTAGLDLLSTEAVLTVLEKYKKQFCCNYLVITHDIVVATRLCNKIYKMDKGRIVKQYIKE